jgi:hypothetical protein
MNGLVTIPSTYRRCRRTIPGKGPTPPAKPLGYHFITSSSHHLNHRSFFSYKYNSSHLCLFFWFCVAQGGRTWGISGKKQRMVESNVGRVNRGVYCQMAEALKDCRMAGGVNAEAATMSEIGWRNPQVAQGTESNQGSRNQVDHPVPCQTDTLKSALEVHRRIFKWSRSHGS